MKKILLTWFYFLIGKDKPEDNTRYIDKSNNYRGKKSHGETGFKGVYKTPGNKYTSTVNIRDNEELIQVYLGTFDTPEEARDKRITFIDSLK